MKNLRLLAAALVGGISFIAVRPGGAEENPGARLGSRILAIAGQAGMAVEEAAVSRVEIPEFPAVEASAVERRDVPVEGAGLVRGGGPLPSDWVFGRAEGSVEVSGKIAVAGEGLSGEAKVRGLVPVKGDFFNKEKIEGCGTVQGSVQLKDSEGKVAGTTTVSGKVCVSGQATKTKIPFIGERWIAYVSGDAQVSGVLRPPK